MGGLRQSHVFSEELIDKLRQSRQIAVLTGAGISAESGLPTFRDPLTGLWAKYDPTRLASRAGFTADPKLVWDWYEHRRAQAKAAEPNLGHLALTEMEARAPRFTLITQNVDGLHHRAGSVSVVELHGNIFTNKCLDEDAPVSPHECAPGEPPTCRRCGGLVRPGVVWFGENLPAGALDRAVRAAKSCDAFLVVGTSGAVMPAAALLQVAAERGATCVAVNVERVTTPPGVEMLTGRAGEILPALVGALWPPAVPA